MINTKYRVICIDAVSQTLREAEMSFEDAQKFVGGWLAPVAMDKHQLFVDEEGLAKALGYGFAVYTATAAGFMRAGHFVGNGVIFGLNRSRTKNTHHSLDIEVMRVRIKFFGRPTLKAVK